MARQQLFNNNKGVRGFENHNSIYYVNHHHHHQRLTSVAPTSHKREM